ncbi:MAG: 2-C-methyl-D-erythritol 2,4-cyclodiphosphate synthase [Termitinemataceae bacterium]|nr:MAG: 2-C-methyl-D-erythritol 2,4-cyclodiphosphate synthase [Termitinemataceae bacterium]
MIRVGIGRDLHRLVRGRELVIGGISIPSVKGELAHSDGDVLLHAVIDALLGAAALGDIGEMFPPSDSAYKNISSILLLKKVQEKVRSAAWNIINIDCVVSLQKPHLLPYRKQICESIAKTLDIKPEAVFVKAKSAEATGDVGKCRAVEAFAVCLLEKQD